MLTNKLAPTGALTLPVGARPTSTITKRQALMANRTDQPQGQPTPGALTPQPNRILAQPVTVAQCRADYEAAADVRQTLAAQEARAQQ